MSRRLLCTLVALAGLALLAGCGQSEKDKYTSKMKSISKQLATEQRQVTGGKNASTPAERGAQFKRLQDVFTRLADRFAAVKAPAKVKDLHQRLTAIVRGFAGSLTPPIQAAQSGDAKQLKATANAFQATLTSFQAQLSMLSRDYRARGYKLS